MESRNAPYLDATQPIAARVADLLSRMTLDEKLAQIGCVWSTQLARATACSRSRGRGRSWRTAPATSRASAAPRCSRPARARRFANAIQTIPGRADPPRHSGDHSRGELRRLPGARRDLLPAGHRSGQHVGAGADRGDDRRSSARRCAPSARIIRWRRCSTWPAIRAGAVPRRRSARIRISSRRWASPTSAACRGRISRTASSATGKHFVGYGASEGGMNWAPAHICRGASCSRSTCAPFAAVDQGGAAGVGHERLQRDRRRARWGRRRSCSSICCAASWASTASWSPTTSPSPTLHAVPSHRARRGRGGALGAGSRHRRRAAGAALLRRAAARRRSRRARVDIALVDAAVRRVLRMKFQLGLFERPYVDADGGAGRLRHRASSARWRTASRRSRSSCSRTTAVCCRSTRRCRRSPSSDRAPTASACCRATITTRRIWR